MQMRLKFTFSIISCFAVQYIITNTLCCHLVIPVTNLKHDPNIVLYVAPSGEKVSDHNLKMPLRRKVKTLKHSCLHNITKDIDSYWCKDYTENYPEGGNKYMHVVGPFDDIRKYTLMKKLEIVQGPFFNFFSCIL